MKGAKLCQPHLQSQEHRFRSGPVAIVHLLTSRLTTAVKCADYHTHNQHITLYYFSHSLYRILFILDCWNWIPTVQLQPPLYWIYFIKIFYFILIHMQFFEAVKKKLKKNLLLERTLEIIKSYHLQLSHISLRSWDFKICLRYVLKCLWNEN